MYHSIALFALIAGLIIVLIVWANVRHLSSSEEDKAETRKAAAEFFGDEDMEPIPNQDETGYMPFGPSKHGRPPAK